VIRPCFLPKHLHSLEPTARKLFEDLLEQTFLHHDPRITLETILARLPEYEVDLENAVRLRTAFVQGDASLQIRF
jgi:hypothetical protein